MLFDSNFDHIGKTDSLIETELEKYPWVSLDKLHLYNARRQIY
jgi:hypothetical protein